jgi:DNA-binding HxlR family transcriptional regulator
MFRGITQFNRFLERIKGLTPKVLTNILKELEKSGIISRKIVSESLFGYSIISEFGKTA